MCISSSLLQLAHVCTGKALSLSYYAIVILEQLRQSETKKMEFLLPNIIKLFETNRPSHFPPFYDDFSYRNSTLKDWIFHFAVICRPELCKRDGIMKTRLATNTNGYPLRLALLFE